MAKLDRSDPENQNCRNCNRPLSESETKFCGKCGQKITDGRVPLRSILKVFWQKAFHLDGKLVAMLSLIFRPARLTQAFFRGQHKKFPHPVQAFFLILVLMLALINHQLSHRKSNNNLHVFGNAVNQVEAKLREIELEKRLISGFDSLPSRFQTASNRVFLDSLNAQVFGDSLEKNNDSLFMNVFSAKIRLKTLDIVELTPDSILKKYQVEGFVNRTVTLQALKSYKDGGTALGKVYLGSLSWTILVLIALMSVVLRLLYFRQKKFYVEHFIFLIHQHSAGFLSVSLALAWAMFFGNSWPLDALVFCSILGFLLVAMRRFYDQSWGKTTLKWAIYLFAYASVFMFTLLGSIFVCFFIF